MDSDHALINAWFGIKPIKSAFGREGWQFESSLPRPTSSFGGLLLALAPILKVVYNVISSTKEKEDKK